MTLKNTKKKQTATQPKPKQSYEKPLKASYYDGLQDEQDEFDRKTWELDRELASKKTDKTPPKK